MFISETQFRNITYLDQPNRGVAQLAKHLASIPKVVDSIPTVVDSHCVVKNSE